MLIFSFPPIYAAFTPIRYACHCQPIIFLRCFFDVVFALFFLRRYFSCFRYCLFDSFSLLKADFHFRPAHYQFHFQIAEFFFATTAIVHGYIVMLYVRVHRSLRQVCFISILFSRPPICSFLPFR